jgi:tetratricopeptide (TPR) repeat protein
VSQASSIDPQALPREQSERRALAEKLQQQARDAHARGDRLTATLHASDLLMLYPNERGYLDTFDEIVTSVDDPLSLFPVSTGAVHVATAAGRARVLMMNRRLDEALALLTAGVEVAPHVPYFHWILRWLQPPIIATMAWETLFPTVVKVPLTVALRVPVPPSEDDLRVINLRAAAEVFAALRGHFSDESILWYGESLLRRRLGEPDRTLAVAEEGVQRWPRDWRLRTGLLNAYRDASRPDDALAQAREAMRLNPDDLSPLHDAGWAFLDAVRPADAAQLFEELVQRDPEYPGARACLHYTRFKASGSAEDREALLRLREREWWDEQIRGFADEVDPPVPFENVLPGPDDATLEAARQVAYELGHVIRCCGLGGELQLRLASRYLESPSVELAFGLAMRQVGASTASVAFDVEEIQQPDPRRDKAQVSTPVWRLEGGRVVAAHGEGDPRAQQAVASVARQPFRREVWDPAARQVAAELTGAAYHQLLSVLTHPPLPAADDGFDAFLWTWRCQVAGALVLSHLGPWATGSARAALYSMVYGPSDWVTGAAVVAFGWRARAEPELRAEIEPIFTWLRSQIPAEGFTSWEIVLAEVWLGLGGHAPAQRQDLEAWIERYYASLPDKNVVRPPERRYAGLSLEDYARFSAERDALLSQLGLTEASGQLQALSQPPEAIVQLCHRYGVSPRHRDTGAVFPYVPEWQEALNADPQLMDRFLQVQRGLELERMGVGLEEQAALSNVQQGNVDMHHRMAQQQAAQREIAAQQARGAGDPDPEVFPGQPVARLSDYVSILKGMQQGDMHGALGRYGLDMMSYGTVAQAWGAKLAADPVLNEKFASMMQR